jgi:hypothetical protein
MRTGQVLIISDGSYNPTSQRGTAAWILESTNSNLHIIGKIRTPGVKTVLSAYRCELAGILSAIMVLNSLARFHNIPASLTLQCDCESGLNKAFGKDRVSLNDSNFDLLKAIHYEINQLNINWMGLHIKGHQDNNTSYNSLDRASQLNILVDHMVKQHLIDSADLPSQDEVHHFSWALKIDIEPVIHDIDNTLYDRVHSPITKKYWL